MISFGIENGSPGLERLPGDGNHGHTASDYAILLKDSDLADRHIVGVGFGVAAEKMGDRGSPDMSTMNAVGKQPIHYPKAIN